MFDKYGHPWTWINGRLIRGDIVCLAQEGPRKPCNLVDPAVWDRIDYTRTDQANANDLNVSKSVVVRQRLKRGIRKEPWHPPKADRKSLLQSEHG